MTTSFLKLKKELKSFAKRVKNFKYTDKLLIVFLLTGAVIGIENNLLAEIADDEITNQIKQINISTANFRKNFKKAKNESNRLIKGANLELIQLMEQGDHVIKPIWASWQFGSNSYYNGWNGFYNGRGDKGNSVDKFFNRSNNAFARNVSPLSSKSRMFSPYLRGSLYGTTRLKDVEEPIVEWEVTPGINPRRVEGIAPLVLASRQEINFQNPEMPTFEVPDGDVEVPPAPVVPPAPSTPGRPNVIYRQSDYSNIKKKFGDPVLVGSEIQDIGSISQTNIRGTSGKGKLDILHNNTEKFKIKTSNTTFTGIEGAGHSTIFTYSNDLDGEFKYINDYRAIGVRLGGGHDFEIDFFGKY